MPLLELMSPLCGYDGRAGALEPPHETQLWMNRRLWTTRCGAVLRKLEEAAVTFTGRAGDQN